MVEFDPIKHEYFADGERVPSVTKVLEPLNNYAAVDPVLLERGQRMGTAVHRATELHDAGTLCWQTLDPRLLPYLEAWQRFRAETGFAPMHTEMTVHHAVLRYAGKFDRVGIVRGRKSVLDIKKMMSLPAIIGLQLAGYQAAYNHTRPPEQHILDRYAVGLHPDGTYRMVQYTDPTDFTIFAAQLQINRWKEKHHVK